MDFGGQGIDPVLATRKTKNEIDDLGESMLKHFWKFTQIIRIFFGDKWEKFGRIRTMNSEKCQILFCKADEVWCER